MSAQRSWRETWHENPQNYIIVTVELKDVDGNRFTGYHIIDVKNSISHIIESQEEVKELAAKMIEAGVKVVSVEESIEILYGDRAKFESALSKVADNEPEDYDKL